MLVLLYQTTKKTSLLFIERSLTILWNKLQTFSTYLTQKTERQKMPLKPFVKVVGNLLSKKNAITSVPMSFLLVGLQALINFHFSCPCKYEWNVTLSLFVLVVPAFFAFVIMLMLLKPWKYKHINRVCSCCQKSKCGESSKKKNNSKGSQEQEKTGQSQEQNESGETRSQTKESCEWVLLACLIPPVVWICIYFIDGDYVACAASKWDGRYACDKELHPVCLNWCKPNEQGNETKNYKETLEAIRASKVNVTGFFYPDSQRPNIEQSNSKKQLYIC